MELRSKEELRLIIENQIRTLLRCSVELKIAMGEERAKSLINLFSATMIRSTLTMRHAGNTRQLLTTSDELLLKKYATSFSKHYNDTVHQIIENVGMPISISLGKDEMTIFQCSEYIVGDLIQIINGTDDFCIHADTVVNPTGQVICNNCGEDIDF